MNIELWWPRLKPSTREWLMHTDGDALPSTVVAEITRAGGEVVTDPESESEQPGVYLSDKDIDWIETVTNEEEPT